MRIFADRSVVYCSEMNSVCYSPDGMYIATGGDDGKVKVWNTSTGWVQQSYFFFNKCHFPRNYVSVRPMTSLQPKLKSSLIILILVVSILMKVYVMRTKYTQL